MPEAKYEVVTKGIIEGEKVAEVRAKLRKLIKNKQANVDLIIDKAELVVKRDLDLETAKKYREGFYRAGVICELRRQDEESLEAMVCPNCGFRQPKADTCIRCGIMVDKYAAERPLDRLSEQSANRHAEEPRDSLGGIMSKLYNIWTFKGGRAGIIVVGLFLAYSIFETIWLRGDLVAYGRIAITSPRNFVEFTVKKGSQKYTIEVYTRQKSKLHVKLVDSSGKVLYEDTEYASHKGSRSFTFKPPKEGRYRLYVGLGPLSFYTFTRASVSVYVNDRRILPRVLGRIKL